MGSVLFVEIDTQLKEGQVGCAVCYEHNAEYKLEMTRELKALGFCIQCRDLLKPEERNKYSRCHKCRAYQNKRRHTYYLAKKQILVQHHLCIECGVTITLINPRTSAPFKRCYPCRVYRSKKAA